MFSILYFYKLYMDFFRSNHKAGEMRECEFTRT
jgi:hypothetical protein